MFFTQSGRQWWTISLQGVRELCVARYRELGRSTLQDWFLLSVRSCQQLHWMDQPQQGNDRFVLFLSLCFSVSLSLSVCLSVLLSRYLLLCPSNVLPAKSFISPRLKINRWILIRFSISTFNHSPQSLLEAVDQCYFNLVTAIVVLDLTKSFDTYIWLEKLQYFWYRCKFPFHD